MAAAGEKALRTALRSRVFDPVYYFFGEDDFLKEASVRELSETAVDPATRDFNLDLLHGGTVDAAQLDAALGTLPMLAERRVVVLRDVERLRKEARRVLESHLARPAQDRVVVLVSGAGVKADRALSGKAVAVEFAPLTGDRVPRWIGYHAQHALGRGITPDAVALLVEAVGTDLSQLALELEKLASYAPGEIDAGAVTSVVGVRREESVGALLDAVAARDAGAAVGLVAGALQQPKTTAVSIVMALTVQTLALGYGQAARRRGVGAGALYGEYMGLLKESGAFPGRSWGEAVRSWTAHVERWSASSVDASLAALLAADEALKETRLSSPEQILSTLVLSLCSAADSRRAA